MSKQTLQAEQAVPCCTPLVREPLTQDWAGDLALMFKALGHPVRLRLLSLVASHQGGDACVCDLSVGFDLTQPTISQLLTTPLMRLHSPADTKVILITLAESTPVMEAAELQSDLERAQIHPWAWVINSSLAAAAPTATLLRQRASEELPQILEVRNKHAARLAVVPMLATEPVGIPAMGMLSRARVAPVR
jgi:DNA-binding transcriptional ArsR family regulator